MVTQQDAVFELPIRIIFTQPRWLLPIFLIAICGAAISIMMAELAGMTTAFLAIVLVVGVIQARPFTRNGSSGLILDAEDHWLVLKGDEPAVAATLNKATVVFGGAIVLVLQSDDKQYYNFILTETNLDRVQLRRLRVRLYYPKSDKA